MLPICKLRWVYASEVQAGYTHLASHPRAVISSNADHLDSDQRQIMRALETHRASSPSDGFGREAGFSFC